MLRPGSRRLAVLFALAALWSVSNMAWAADAKADWTVTITSVDPRRPAAPHATVRVSDERGLSVLGLSAPHFRVLHDGVPVPFTVTSRLRRGDPVAVTLVVDRSASVRGAPLRALAQAVEAFCATLNDEDLVGLVSFSSRWREEVALTRDKGAVIAAVERLRASGRSAVWDALQYALERPWPADVGRHTVVLLTDGYDNRSRSTWQQAAATAHEGASVFTIALSPAADTERLAAVASACGGDSFTSPTIDDLAAIYRQIADRLQSEYEITCDTTGATERHARRLDVEVSQSGRSNAASFHYFTGPRSGLRAADPLRIGLLGATAALTALCAGLTVVWLRRRGTPTR